MKTFLFFAWFWSLLFFTSPFTLIYFFLRMLGFRKYPSIFIQKRAAFWGKHMMNVAGIKTEVRGLEHLPKEANFCYVSNHQGNFDVGAVLASVPTTVGYVAKKELAFFPGINLWMYAMGCIFIDRKNGRKAIGQLKKGVKRIHKGFPILLFPEGTRSRGPKMLPFKTGGINLLIQEEVPIVPITLDGAYHSWEESKTIRGGKITVTIHPLIETKNLTPEEKRLLPQRLKEQIESALGG